MQKRKQGIGKTLRKKSARETRRIGKGVVREGRKIVTGAVKGFLNVFNPFR